MELSVCRWEGGVWGGVRRTELTLYLILQHILFFYLLVLEDASWQSYYRKGPRGCTPADNTAPPPPYYYYSSSNQDEREARLFQMAPISTGATSKRLVFIVQK
jgi:hypothetical protein